MLLPGGTKVENGEVMYLLACVLGFSLERALDSPLSRRLAENNEPCKESCDAGQSVAKTCLLRLLRDNACAHARHCLEDAWADVEHIRISVDLFPVLSLMQP